MGDAREPTVSHLTMKPEQTSNLFSKQARRELNATSTGPFASDRGQDWSRPARPKLLTSTLTGHLCDPDH